MIDIEGKGLGLYMFEDDSNGDDYVSPEEVYPVAIFEGLSVNDIDFQTQLNILNSIYV